MGLETVLTVAAIATVVAEGVQTYTTIEAAGKAKKAAKKQRGAKIQQVRIAERLETARTKRRQRLRAAQITASLGAAGIKGSVLETPLAAGEAQEAGQIELIGSQADIRERQARAEYTTTAARAEAEIGQAIGSFVSTAASAGSGLATGLAALPKGED